MAKKVVGRSETRKPHREATEAWKEYLDRIRDVISKANRKSLFVLDGTRFSPATYDPADLAALLAQSHQVCVSLLGVVEKIHWPIQRYDSDGCISDESALEMAIRCLRDVRGENHSEGVQGAWSLAYQAVRRYCEWRDNQYYASLGVDFGAYFAAELDAILHVIEQDHLRRAGEISAELAAPVGG